MPSHTYRGAMSSEMLGNWVRDRRKALGYRTQAALAGAMTADLDDPELVVSVGYVGGIEAGRTESPRQPNLAALAKTLKTSQTHILELAGVITDAGKQAPVADDDARTAELVGLVRLADWSEDHWYDATRTLVDAVIRDQRQGGKQ